MKIDCLVDLYRDVYFINNKSCIFLYKQQSKKFFEDLII